MSARLYRAIRPIPPLGVELKRFFQRLTHGAIRLGEKKALIDIKKRDSQPVEQVQEMANKADAIQNRNFRPVRLIVNSSCILAHFLVECVGRDKKIIINT